MAKRQIVTIHSYRGCVGRSNPTANISVCAQDAGFRVSVMDTDLQSPGIHFLFNFDQKRIKLTFYDFLRGKCLISQVAYDVSDRIDPESAGRCWLIPAWLTLQAITCLLDEGYDIDRLPAQLSFCLSHPLSLFATIADHRSPTNKSSRSPVPVVPIKISISRLGVSRSKDFHFENHAL